MEKEDLCCFHLLLQVDIYRQSFILLFQLYGSISSAQVALKVE